jgi:hypothetical protein
MTKQVANTDPSVIRAVSIPVATVLDGEWSGPGSFLESLYEAWRQSTMLANWAARELLRNDVSRTPDLKRLPPMPPIYLYGRLRAKNPDDPAFAFREYWNHTKQMSSANAFSALSSKSIATNE